MTDIKHTRRRAKSLIHKYIPGMINCAQFEAFVIDYCERTLPIGQRLRFDAHLKFCRECRDYLAAYKQTIALGKAAFDDPAGPLPEDVPDDLVKAILSAREQDS
jgi:anti-sigma factor RsiW